MSVQQVPELRLPLSIEADDLAVENAPATAKIISEALAQTGKGPKDVPVAGDQADAIGVGVEQGAGVCVLSQANIGGAAPLGATPIAGGGVTFRVWHPEQPTSTSTEPSVRIHTL